MFRHTATLWFTLASIMCISSILTSRAAAQVKQAPPPLQVVPDDVNLGILTPKKGSTTTIELKNLGSETLTVLRAAGSCPCLAISVRDKQIKPGESTQIIIGIDVPEDIGPFSRNVQVVCENFAVPFQFRVRGDISYGVYVNKGSSQSLIRSKGIIALESLDKETFRVIAVNGEPPIFMPMTDGSKQELSAYVLRYDYSDKSILDLPRWVVIETDHPEATLIDIKMASADVWDAWRPIDRWRVFEDRLNLHDVKAGDWVESSAALTGIQFQPDLDIGVRSSNPEVEVRLKEIRKPSSGGGTECVFELRVPAERRGYFGTVLYFEKSGQASGLDVFGRAVAEISVSRPKPTPVVTKPGK